MDSTTNAAGLAAAATAAGGPSRPPRPRTTAIRRISRGSLSALSASRSGQQSDGHFYEGHSPLFHLAPAFAELSEAVQDLAANLKDLDEINNHLNGFNEGFAGLLYGLRMNAYTCAFPGAPDALNFQHAEKKAARQAEEEREARLQAEAEKEAQEEQDRLRRAQSEESVFEQGQQQHAQDATFYSMRGDSDFAPSAVGGARKSGLPQQQRGKGVPAVRGGKTAAQRKKEANIKFATPIISTLPLEYREKQPQRADMETVIGALKDNRDGLRVQELVKMFPLIPQHRINDSLLTLVRAKHAIKLTSGGLVYRLDPLKYPPTV